MAIATIEIDRQAILYNIEYLKKVAPNSELIAIIKANAYGHGMLNIASLLQNKVACFGVARLSEAVALRKAKINTPILLLEGFFPHDDINVLIDYNLQTVIHSRQQIQRLRNLNVSNKIVTWFKIDTGMHRLGFLLDDAKQEFECLASCNSVCKPINVMSHFSSADELTSQQTMKQIELFDEFIDFYANSGKVGKCSIAASGGILAWPASHKDAIRPGISLYGASPFSSNVPELKPAMTFKSELIAIRSHKQGESVGYGEIWTSKTDTKLGVVAMGYGDGYPRNIPAGTPVLINGRKVPIVGRVSMDMIVVDLGITSLDNIGDDVIFWGRELPVEDIANHTGISAYELLTRLTTRATINMIN